MTRLRDRLAGDAGLTLIELMIAFFIASLIAGVMINWLVTVGRSDQYEQEASVALEEMRGAKGGLVKELRFAESINVGASNNHKVVVWVDENDNDAFDPSTGETVTWEFHADGTLTRSTDAPAATPELRASNLIYDAAAGPDSSRFWYDATNTRITIQLVADVAAADGPEAKRIRTEVHLRS